jgi:hypothetical protein
MEGRSVVTAFLFAVFFAACTKESIIEDHQVPASELQEIAPVKQAAAVFASSWETIPAWNAQTSPEAITFSYSKTLPALAGDNLVMVFARNLWPDDPAMKELGDTEKPLLMPFYFLPYFEKPNYTEQWNYNTTGDKIELSLVVKGGEDAAVPGKKVQVRYVIIPQTVLKQKKQTAEVVRKMSYDQLTKAFGLS